MKRRRQNPKPSSGQPAPKSLSIRYAEVLKLREAISQTQSKLTQQKESGRRSVH
ncbi:MAG: hypothetical protein HY852_16370 [Bradyrhizobium sp.]|uniref:hypothetical protein n=1 Tax=Bradyrhizobium sp. TaxID=376 RepID=UPI0025B9EE4A|nr:hypothetical protein [Bradyrhizobium sp.]MBI5263385.1 hypothetical protein [Bradyrhizobium sp.]